MISTIHVVNVDGSIVDGDDQLLGLVAETRVQLRRHDKAILVHGAEPQLSDLLDSLGIDSRKGFGLRATSPSTMRAVAMVQCGLINTRLVSAMVAGGITALGVSGVDLGLMHADFLNRERLGRVGGPPRIRADIVELLLSRCSALVVAPVALGPDGSLLNLRANQVAHTLAGVVDASSLDFITGDKFACAIDGRPQPLSPKDVEAVIAEREVPVQHLSMLQTGLAAADDGIRVRVGNLDDLRRGRAATISNRRPR